MKHSPDDFDLQDLWQQSPPVDVDALVQSVLGARRRMKRFFYFELVSSVFGLGFLGLMMWLEVFGSQWWIPTLIGVVAVALQLWSWSWRRGLWDAMAQSPRELFELKRRHLLLDIKIARSCYLGVLVGMVMGFTVRYFDNSERALELSEPMRYSILAGAVVMLVWMFVWGVRKEMRARKQLNKLDKQMDEFDEVESL